MEKFRWCIIGAGALAKSVAEEILASGRHEITSVYSRRMESSVDYVAKYGGKAFANVEEAISQDNVDGVYIVTPHTSHHEYSLLALNLDKPVLNEKPFTVNAKETKEILDLARAKNIYIAEAMWTWFAEGPHKVKSWIDAGELGDISKAELIYTMNTTDPDSRIVDPARAGGGLLDIGVYPITYLYRLFGYPTDIKAEGVVENGIDLSETIYLTFSNGLEAKITVAINDPAQREELLIEGNLGKIDLPGYHHTAHANLERSDGSVEHFTGAAGYLNQFDIVADEIRRGLLESEKVPHQATYDVMKIMDECRRQIDLVYPGETLADLS